MIRGAEGKKVKVVDYSEDELEARLTTYFAEMDN